MQPFPIAALLAVLGGACSSSTTPAQLGCGADSVDADPPHSICFSHDTGVVNVVVNNSTTHTLAVYWWWYAALGDSAHVAASTAGFCVHFTANTWAQIEGDLPSSPQANFTEPFSPKLHPNWSIDATPPNTVTFTALSTTAC